MFAAIRCGAKFASSGIELQRKYESRVASSWSLTFRLLESDGVVSARYRKFGEVRIARTPYFAAAQKSPCFGEILPCQIEVRLHFFAAD